MKKAKTKKQGGYCPKRPGYSWAYTPKKNRDDKESRPKSGGNAAKEIED